LIASGSLHVIFDILDRNFGVSTEIHLVQKISEAFRYLCEIAIHRKDRKNLTKERNTKSPLGNLVNARALLISREMGASVSETTNNTRSRGLL